MQGYILSLYANTKEAQRANARLRRRNRIEARKGAENLCTGESIPVCHTIYLLSKAAFRAAGFRYCQSAKLSRLALDPKTL